MKRITLKKGERRRILHLISDSIPQTVRFEAHSADGASPVRGLVEAERASLLGRRPGLSLALTRENELKKGFWDSWYSVYVTPEQDTEIVFRSRHFTAKWLFIVLGLVLLLGLSAGLLPLILGGASN